MLKHARISRRFLLPLALAISLLFAFVPAALVVTHAQSPSLRLFGPKQHYLALGDSLAYGLQPNCSTTCTHGYVNDLFPILHSEGTKDVTNLGCTASSNFGTDLARLDNNLTQVILPQLRAALTVNGRVTGSIVMMNYYNPFPNCLASAQFTQAFNEFNTHLATDVSTFGFIVDVLGAFGGITTPNICTYTWICTVRDIHPTDLGYNVIANTFAAAIPPN